MSSSSNITPLFVGLLGVLVALALLSSAAPAVSGPSSIQHRVQPGNGQGHLIKAIKDKRLQEHLINRLAARFGPAKRSEILARAANKTAASAESRLQQKLKAQAQTPAASTLGMQDYFDMFWLGNITIGSTDQGPFSVVFDTGSSDLWVVDSTCGTGPSFNTKKQCATSQLFNASTSNSYKAGWGGFFDQYGDGSFAFGIRGIDTVKIGDSSGGSPLVIPSTGFGRAIIVDTNTLSMPMDGILGLGFQFLSDGWVVPPFLNAVAQGIVPQPIFSIYLETESNETGVDAAPAGGTFTFGGLDTTNCGDVVGWADLTSASFWQFSYDSINVGGKDVPIGGMDVISDSGTSLLVGDADIVKPIAKAVGAKLVRDWGVYTIACDATYSPVTFVINGNSFNLTSSVLNIDIGIGNNKCLFGAVPVEDMSYWMGLDWILGDPFIRQYCAVHDVANQQIGFAPALAMVPSS